MNALHAVIPSELAANLPDLVLYGELQHGSPEFVHHLKIIPTGRSARHDLYVLRLLNDALPTC